MKERDLVQKNSIRCPFFSGFCLSRFGQFACSRCPSTISTAVPEFASDKAPDWDTYRILIFDWALGPSGSDIRWYIKKQHGDANLDFINFQHLFWNKFIDPAKLQQVADNLKHNRYSFVYITTQDKKIRQKIRRLFQEQFGIDVHIKTYAKLVRNVNIQSMRK